MAKKQESKGNIEKWDIENSYIEDMTGPDIFDAIRYLEPDRAGGNEPNRDTAFVVCVTIVILLLGCLGLMWLYLR
jgi:hypothetical protein